MIRLDVAGVPEKVLRVAELGAGSEPATPEFGTPGRGTRLVGPFEKFAMGVNGRVRVSLFS
jgi:hypothetical protein